MAVKEPRTHEFMCGICGRAWSSSADGKWPIRVTDGDPPRVIAHCPTCAELGAGYEARWCPVDARPRPPARPDRNGAASLPAPIPAAARLRDRLTEVRLTTGRWWRDHPEAQFETPE